jgi:hypothetical protein
MRSLRLLLGTVFTMAMLLVCLFGPAKAQLTYDVANYKALVDADSAETIPPGTKITLQNWRQYKNFMPMWVQAAFSGAYKWHVGADPAYTVVVGPTRHYPWPRQYVEDTENTAVRPSWCRCPAAAFHGRATRPAFRSPIQRNPTPGSRWRTTAGILFNPRY